MKVILLKDVKKQGKKDDIIEVSDGYGMNYLIKNGLAVAATKTSTKILSNELDKRKQEEEELVKKMQEMRDKIIRENITFKVKTGAMDKVFGNVSSKQIADVLTTALIAGFIPGASPPLVNTPIVLISLAIYISPFI